MGKLWSDEKLIAEMRQGGISAEKALNNIYFHSGWERSIKYNLIKGRVSPEVEKELFQDAMIILYQKIVGGDYRRGASLRTFLGGIAKNLFYKRAKKEQSGPKQVEVEQAIEAERVSLKGEFSEEELNYLLEIIESRKRNCKELMLAEYHGIEREKMAIQFGFKDSHQVSNKISKCRNALKQALKTHPHLLHHFNPSIHG
ncbi:MAG: sigma-70 family RNA polymerase sigma factor [Bacteroidota bacterium]